MNLIINFILNVFLLFLIGLTENQSEAVKQEEIFSDSQLPTQPETCILSSATRTKNSHCVY